MENTKERILLGKNLQQSSKFSENLIEGAICLNILEDERVKKLIYEYDGKKYLNVKVVKRKSANNYGKTHFIEVNQFVPKQQEQQTEPLELCTA